jgi:paired amphipathic helix protein Sin3a
MQANPASFKRIQSMHPESHFGEMQHYPHPGMPPPTFAMQPMRDYSHGRVLAPSNQGVQVMQMQAQQQQQQQPQMIAPAGSGQQSAASSSMGGNVPIASAGSAPPPEARPLNVKDALSYLDMVKMKFSDNPDVYNRFLDVMKDFKSHA